VANQLLKKVGDWTKVEGRPGGVVTKEMAPEALKKWGIDEKGLEEMHRRMLYTIIEKFEEGQFDSGGS
jgi:Holliday junction resolvasome RuvABC ATP-dependent DNA helicase subunit